RPSARLKGRIFARPVTAEPKEPTFRFSWLPPATAALLLLCVLFNQHSSQALSSAGANPLIAIALSNQSVAPFLDGSFSREHNGLPRETFEWTNGSHLPSAIGSRSISGAAN
ncbi:MAG TPA: hypothetical protein VL793_04750, partial [Patescibacteria group bacterium]|nr:hypothetical protein [Patescibacteria group bacterium]